MEALRRVLAIIVPTLLVAMALPATAPTDGGQPDFRPMSQLGNELGRFYDVDAPPAGLDPVAAAMHGLTERDVQGRTPMAWMEWARATYVPAPTSPVAATAEPTRLVTDVVRLYGELGLTLGTADVLDLYRQAHALPAPIAPAFTQLVHVVTDAYADQVPLADELIARWPSGFTYGENFVTPAERDEMATRAARITQAIEAFRIAAEALPPELAAPAGTPLFADPEELVVLGGPGDDVYERTGLIDDNVLTVDLGGNDAYYTSAGGADPSGIFTTGLGTGNGLVLSVAADLDGDDRYEHIGAPASVHGSGSLGGIGILLDAAGNDVYDARLTRTNGPFGPTTYFDANVQGSAFGGFGLLLDAAGDDHYRFDVGSTGGRSVWAFGQGFGALGSVGLLIDEGGHDRYLSLGVGMGNGGGGFQGLYVQGVGFWGGAGIQLDLGSGNDRYHGRDNATTTDYYAQAFGAFGGFGMLVDDGGDDDYVATEAATAPFIDPLLNCAFGTASFGGVGVFVDLGGNDLYYGDTITPYHASTMNEGFGGPGVAGLFNAYGLFVDIGGNDEHVMLATGGLGGHVSGRGVILDGENAYGNYLDLGGSDTYVGPGADDSVWIAGADING